MSLKTKEGRGKPCPEAGMSMKTQEIRVEAGNVIEKTGGYWKGRSQKKSLRPKASVAQVPPSGPAVLLSSDR
jgi:hypothetical protein